ncbi:MAG TPA: hypothetical protein VIM68_01660, partial [Thermoanaerobaculia bacterium]
MNGNVRANALPSMRRMQELGDICVKLRRWPRRIVADDRSLARLCLEFCRQLFEAPQVVLL